jgi:ADP-ribosyl-[dinitrogen reductase] hydrolase
MKNNILGCLYGQLIGDALGGRYEFMRKKHIEKLIKRDVKDRSQELVSSRRSRVGSQELVSSRRSRVGFLPMLGQGQHNLAPGQVTDDSEMALGLLHSIIERNGFDKYDVAKRYIKWFKSPPFDKGMTTSMALLNATNYDQIVRNASFQSKSLSNGCLMRISPLGIYGTHLGDTQLIKYAIDDCLMTHHHPVAHDAVSVYVIAIKYAVLGYSRKDIYNKAFSVAKTKLIKQILIDAKGRPTPTMLEPQQNARNPTMLEDGKRIDMTLAIGYLGHALQNSFYELLHGKSFYLSLIDVILRGGDTDTNGCIVSALLGAYYGVNEIPTDWIETVKNVDNRRRRRQYNEVDQSNMNQMADALMR